MIRICQDIPLGAIVHVTSGYRWGIGPGRRLGISEKIQQVLNDGCHDAIVVEQNGVKMIGDMSPPRAHTTPIARYEERCNNDRATLEFYWPRDATLGQGATAAQWWMQNVCEKKRYDWYAFPLLFLKAAIDPTMDFFKFDWHVEWADWCTESVMWAWLNGASVDCYRGNRNPTPATTLKRYAQGHLFRITDDFIVQLPEGA